MTDERPLIPPVVWAQRNTVVYITVCVEDCKNPLVNIEREQIDFHSVAGSQQKLYHLTIPLFGEIEPENSKTTIGGRLIEIVLQKTSDDVNYWPYLTKENIKYHWLKVDFNKWIDEDEDSDSDSDSDDETERNYNNTFDDTTYSDDEDISEFDLVDVESETPVLSNMCGKGDFLQ